MYKVPAGWPRSASDLSLPSIRMADNVRHVVGPVLAPDVAMDTPPVVPVAQGGPVYAVFTQRVFTISKFWINSGFWTLPWVRSRVWVRVGLIPNSYPSKCAFYHKVN